MEESRKGSAKEFVCLRNENSWAFICDLKFHGRISTFAGYNASQAKEMLGRSDFVNDLR